MEKARVETDDDPGDHEFEIKGTFVLGALSNGIDVLNEEVLVRFSTFEQTIPAGSFERHDEGFRFTGNSSGIERLDIDDDGEYRVEGHELDLSHISFPSDVNFVLEIGDDLGEWDIPFDQDGRFDNPDPSPSPSPSPSPTGSPSPSPSP
ncbi:MAG: hypothetical protein ACE5IY_12855, partial [bacterium]